MSLLAAILALAAVHGNAAPLPTSARAEHVLAEVAPRIAKAFNAANLEVGSKLYLRVFKEERELELWVADKGAYRLYKTYPICTISGDLGPKTADGDNQAPEGFYDVKPQALNPTSFFHLSMNIGYPNAYDRAKKRTGSLIMIHGNCVSAGCFAMTDQGIEEIYAIVHAAFKAGATSVPVHIFPFRMTSANFGKHAKSKWLEFWQELRPAYDAFEANRLPPVIGVAAGKYAVAAEAHHDQASEPTK